MDFRVFAEPGELGSRNNRKVVGTCGTSFQSLLSSLLFAMTATAKGASFTTPFETSSNRGGFSPVASSTTVRVLRPPGKAGSATPTFLLLLLIKSNFSPFYVWNASAPPEQEVTFWPLQISPGPKFPLTHS